MFLVIPSSNSAAEIVNLYLNIFGDKNYLVFNIFVDTNSFRLWEKSKAIGIIYRSLQKSLLKLGCINSN